MKDARVAILDASHSLFHVEDTGPKGPTMSHHVPRNDSMVLQPIPDFRHLISEVVCEVLKEHGGRISPIDIGVICSANSVPFVGRILSSKILQRLKS